MQAAGRGEAERFDPATALALRARETPEEPALFYPEGLDVRWISWRTLARRVDDFVAPPGPGEGTGGSPGRSRRDPDRDPAEDVIEWLAGRSEADPRLAEEAARLDERLARAFGGADAAGSPLRSGDREIVLAQVDPNRAGDPETLAWCLARGVALVLEPDPRSVPGLASWARPTVVAAGAQPLAELARWVRGREEKPSPGRRLARALGLAGSGPSRRPFGRLRLLVVLGDGRLPVDDVPFWADRGVAVVRAAPIENGPTRAREIETA